MMKHAKHLQSLIEYMQSHGRIIKQEELAELLAISRKHSKKIQMQLLQRSKSLPSQDLLENGKMKDSWS